MAERAARTVDQAHLERAMRLEPNDAEYPYRLGVFAFRVQQDNNLAKKSFQRALALNPYRTRYWLSLASVYLTEGDIEKQKATVQAALNAEPRNPETTWEAGNLDLVEGDTERALHNFRITLESERYNELGVFDTCWRATRDADLILKDAIPNDNRVRIAFLRWLVQHNEPAAAAKVWSAVAAAQQSVHAADALPYVDFLLSHGDVGEAYRVWRQLLAGDEEMKGYAAAGNRVVNDRFEEPLLNSGFDWRIAGNPAVSLSLDSLEFRDRGRSLKLVFSGDPFRDAGLSQLVPVDPNTTYRFSAYVKSEEIYSASAPRFALDDAASGQSLLLTKDVIGTTPWEQLEGEFRTGPATQAVRLHIVQSAGAHIKGNLWVDGITIAAK